MYPSVYCRSPLVLLKKSSETDEYGLGPPPCPVETWTNSSEDILPLVVGNQFVFDGMNDPDTSGEAPGLRRG
jgi:hypothetical protein